MLPTTAILLFSRSAGAEAAAKGFGSDYGLSLSVAGALLERTKRTLAKSGFPVFQVDETEQYGADFGHRLANAATDTFAKGYDRLLVVGNDCPQLQTAHLRAAAKLLENGSDVIGPDGRGGAWMIGLQRENFDAATFASLEWKTGELLGELTTYFGDVAPLRTLNDVNVIQDLRKHWHYLKVIFGELFSLIFDRTATVATDISWRATDGQLRRKGRGPPALGW